MPRAKAYVCSLCGERWPRDPALEVPCPRCLAPVGVKCRRPSGHPLFGAEVHHDRDHEAMRLGKLKKCPGRPTPNHAGVAGR